MGTFKQACHFADNFFFQTEFFISNTTPVFVWYRPGILLQS